MLGDPRERLGDVTGGRFPGGAQVAAHLRGGEPGRVHFGELAGALQGLPQVRALSEIRAGLHSEDPHRFGNALQLLVAAVVGLDLVAVHREPDGLGEQHLAGVGETQDARGDVDGLAEDVAFFQPDLAHVDADADLDPVPLRDALVPLPDAVLHRGGAEDGVGG